MAWSLRKNDDPALPASHLIELQFRVPPKLSFLQVPGITLSGEPSSRGGPLRIALAACVRRSTRRRGECRIAVQPAHGPALIAPIAGLGIAVGRRGRLVRACLVKVPQAAILAGIATLETLAIRLRPALRCGPINRDRIYDRHRDQQRVQPPTQATHDMTSSPIRPLWRPNSRGQRCTVAP